MTPEMEVKITPDDFKHYCNCGICNMLRDSMGPDCRGCGEHHRVNIAIDKERKELHGKLCRAREEIPELLDGIDRDDLDNTGWWETSKGVEFGEEVLRKVKEALSSPGPCRHKQEKEEIIGEAEFWHKKYQKLRQENARLREAVEYPPDVHFKDFNTWTAVTQTLFRDYWQELRRRAGVEGKKCPS